MTKEALILKVNGELCNLEKSFKNFNGNLIIIENYLNASKLSNDNKKNAIKVLHSMRKDNESTNTIMNRLNGVIVKEYKEIKK